MNNEIIKEILEFKENADYKKLSCDEIAILKDYITNLQHTEDLYNQLLKDYDEEVEENIKLTKLWKNEVKKRRKAVEYVDIITNKGIYESGYGKGTAITICKEHLLDILNSRSDE